MAALVYFTGGTKNVYAHLSYLPIFYGAIRFGTLGGALSGAAISAALGPLMPLDVSAAIAQAPENWIVRCLLFTGIGALAGALIASVLDAEERERRRLQVDELTGLLRDAGLRDIFGRTAPGTACWALAIDFNAFVRMARLIGNDSAEKLIHEAAQLMRGQFPDPRFSIARIHTDLFVVIGGEAEVGRADEHGRRFLANLGHELRLDEHLAVPLEPRLGVATDRDGAMDVMRLVRNATVALADAHHGSQQVHFFDPERGSTAIRNLRLLSEFEAALSAGQLELFYQPKIDLQARTVSGFEALLRWRHPEHGFVPPGRFIPLVEQTALINPLSQWVLRAALAQTALWRQAGHDLTVAVNLSARNLDDPSLIDLLDGLVGPNADLDPRNLEIEITETTVVRDPREASRFVNELSRRGVGVALDDFGTGYASLAFLHEVPLTTLKIDRSFVDGLPAPGKSREIADSIIRLGRQLDLRVVAEGVETAPARDYLKLRGCDLAQGYLFGKPMSAADADDWLRTWRFDSVAEAAPAP